MILIHSTIVSALLRKIEVYTNFNGYFTKHNVFRPYYENEKVSNAEDDLNWSGEYQVLRDILTGKPRIEMIIRGLLIKSAAKLI